MGPSSVCPCEDHPVTTWTFTGVDEWTDLKWLAHIGVDNPHVEFAILVGSDTGKKTIFPPTKFVEKFRALGKNLGVRTAIHLCGRYSRMAVSDDPGVVRRLVNFVGEFGRVQVNMTSEMVRQHSKGLTRLADQLKQVIVQHRDTWDMVPMRLARHHNIRFLFDRSGGRGLVSINSWPIPPDDSIPELYGKATGYAGGLGPQNIDKVIRFANDFPEHILWFDMESRLRIKGRFNLRRVEEVLLAVRQKQA